MADLTSIVLCCSLIEKLIDTKKQILSNLEWNWLLGNVDIRSHVLNFVVMHAKIANRTLMGRKKKGLKGPIRRVIMKVEPSIKVRIDESSYVATKVVNPTIDMVIVNESPFDATKIVNPTTNRVHANESRFAPTKVVNPTTNRIFVDESPFFATKVVNPTTNKVLVNESPSTMYYWGC